jgi:hypothetical protein
MSSNAEVVRALREELEKLPDRPTVDRTVIRGGRDRELEDLTDRVAYELGRRFRREGLQ